ncbi:MAG: outer membrane protein assembly factor BamB [Pseudomonadales bacterium]|jgi:outer membrane protein assembly factor BamB|nr:outer membrane protein assembly factor BamB [Pseudomonadales bacterium]
MSQLLRAFVLGALLLGLPGCSWFGGDDEEEGPAPLMEFEPEGRLKAVWRARIGDGLGKRYTRIEPVVVRGTLYAADVYGVVEARELETGQLRWRTRVDVPAGSFLSSFAFWGRDDDDGSFVTGGLGADDFAVFLGTKDGALIALRANDGGELWRAQLSSEILAPTASDDARVYVMTGDGRLTALSRSDGSRLWSFDTQVPVLSLRGTSAPVVQGPLVFAGFANGRVVALRSDEGQVLWEHVVALPTGRSELERIADVDSSPLPTGVGVFVGSYQGAVKGLRIADGNPQWERPLSTHEALAEGYGDIYVTDENGSLYALDQVSGAVDWQQDGLARRGVTGPAVVSAYVAVGDAEGYVHLFAQSDGRPIARLRVDSAGVRDTPLGVGDRLVVLANDGRLVVYEFELRD